MSELAPIKPSTPVPAVKKIGQKHNQNKREKQAEDNSTYAEHTEAGDQPDQHIDEIV